MDNVAEIKDAITKFKADPNFTSLRLRWEGDFEKFHLKPYNAGEGYVSYTSNTPRVIADKTIALLVDSSLMVHIPEDIIPQEERERANNVERFIYGSQNINDKKALYIPGKPNNRQLKSWYATVRGSFADRIYVHKEDEETFPEITIWDIYNTCYGYDSKGVTWAAYCYKIPAKQAKEEYKIEAGTTEVDVIDYWDREENVFIVRDKEIRRFKHGLDYCPVFIFRVGATPVVWQDDTPSSEQYAGESIYAPNRGIIPILNKTMSDLTTLVRRGVKVPLVEWTFDGKPRIDKDIYQVEKAGIITNKVGEPEPKPLLPQSMPNDTEPLISFIVGEIQRGGYSHTSLGELGFRLSGYAISQLQAALATVVTPFVTCLEQSYLVESLELIKQYGGKDWTPVKVRGRTSRNEAFGYPIPVEISPSDVVGNWHPEVRLEPVMPKDDAQRYELARMAREGEIPLLSDRTIRTDLLGVRDSDLEDTKIDREWADKQLINRMYDAYLGYIEDGAMDKAVNQLAALRLAMSQIGGGQSSRGTKMTPTRLEAAGTPGAGMPTGKTGMSAKTLPPEQLGGMPPGSLNASPATAEGEAT